VDDTDEDAASRARALIHNLDDAAGIVQGLFVQGSCTEAADMLNRGLSPEQVKQQAASAVVEDILEQNRPPPEAPESVNGMRLKLLGGAVLVVGIGRSLMTGSPSRMKSERSFAFPAQRFTWEISGRRRRWPW
jgi:hypothetical protein